jgi:hypothetical protein
VNFSSDDASFLWWGNTEVGRSWTNRGGDRDHSRNKCPDSERRKEDRPKMWARLQKEGPKMAAEGSASIRDAAPLKLGIFIAAFG